MSAPLTIGSLFSGIGGLELGLERGIGNSARTIWQVEQSEYCRAVLARHWPDATRYDDVRTVGRATLAPVDVVCGGFPCQPHSRSGKQEGADDGRYLWPEYERIVRELRPRFVVVENVSNLLADGTALRVLGDLASLGYDAEWSVVSACAVGAPHLRERLFILAYADGLDGEARVRSFADGAAALRADHRRELSPTHPRAWVEDPSALYGGADGVPDRVDRGHALGNAVVPQVAEVVGRLIAEREAQLNLEQSA